MAYFLAALRQSSTLRRAVSAALACLCAATALVATIATPISAGPLLQQDQTGEATTTLADSQATIVETTAIQPTTTPPATQADTAPTESSTATTGAVQPSSTTLTSSTEVATTAEPVDTSPQPTVPDSAIAESTIADGTGSSAVETTVVDGPGVETTVAGTPVTGPDGSIINDPAATVDPLTGEAPNDEAPDGSITVPEPDRTYNQAGYKAAEVLWSSVAAAESKLADVELKRVESIRQIRTLRVRLKELNYSKEELGVDSEAALEQLLERTDQIKGRAMSDYMTHSRNGRTNEALFSASPGDDGGVDFDAILAGQRELRLNELVISVGNEQLDELADLKGSLDSESFEIFERLRVTTESLAVAEEAMAAHDVAADQAKIEYEAFSIGSEVFIEGAVFPIARPYSLPLIDSFGFPRMPGTADEHWHEGIDIFAPKGTPLLATERGVIARLGSGRLGGLKFWLVGESGSEWYYAHLDSFAPGLVNGMVVEAGDLVGYVGNTGNARTTPPHLHMELHPGGGRPVNPYPILKVISDVDILGIENGTFTDSPYQPYVQPGSENEAGADQEGGTESTVVDGTVVDGTVVDGTVVDGTVVQGEDTTTSESTTTQPESTTTQPESTTSELTTTSEPSTSTAPPGTQPPSSQTATTTPAEESTTQPPTSTDTQAESVPAIPTCASSESDPDGDGWGFENDESCLVP